MTVDEFFQRLLATPVSAIMVGISAFMISELLLMCVYLWWLRRKR